MVKAVVNPVPAQLEAILLGCFFAIKDRALDAPHFYNRTKATWAKDGALRVPIESRCEGWHRRARNQKTFVTLHSPLPSHLGTLLKILSGVKMGRFVNEGRHASLVVFNAQLEASMPTEFPGSTNG